MERFDKIEFRAELTKEGYLVDTPVVARAGIQVYRRKDGTIRREFRPPEEVSKLSYLESFSGKPITFLHPKQMVNSGNVRNVLIGSANGKAFVEDSEDPNVAIKVRTPLIVYDKPYVQKILNKEFTEISVGYKIKLDETPGIWNGQVYDAIQRDLEVNHISIVPKGRANIARFNLDSDDAVIFTNGEKMADQIKIRLDNGIEYAADPEIAVEFEKLRKDKADLEKEIADSKSRYDSLLAERDTLKAKVENAEQVRKDALEKARKEIKARAELELSVSEFKIDKIDELSDREIKEIVIKTVRKDADLTGKSDDYIQAAFDYAMEDRKNNNVAQQRQAGVRKDSAREKSSYEKFMESLGKKENE